VERRKGCIFFCDGPEKRAVMALSKKCNDYTFEKVNFCIPCRGKG
jgi:hypothetical protein